MKIRLWTVTFGLVLTTPEILHADMDRWEVLAMRNRYAEQNPETLGRPDAEMSVPDPTPPSTAAVHVPIPVPRNSAQARPAITERPVVIPPPKFPDSNTPDPPPRPAINVPVPQHEQNQGTLAPTVSNLRREAHRLAEKKLVYKFGSDDVDRGGLDCSATVQYLLSERLGVKGVPRTSYLQYEWLEKKGTLVKLRGKRASDKLLKKLSPGDLIFWGKTWSSGHRVSHVMIYMGWNPNNGKHYVFGARGSKKKGLTGAGVDVFELNPNRGVLVGHGPVPGLKND